jgi:hypothetical protein
VISHHFPRQFGDPFGISVIAHTSHDRNSTPVETQRGGQTSRFTTVIKVCLSCHTGNTGNKGVWLATVHAEEERVEWII